MRAPLQAAFEGALPSRCPVRSCPGALGLLGVLRQDKEAQGGREGEGRVEAPITTPGRIPECGARSQLITARCGP